MQITIAGKNKLQSSADRILWFLNQWFAETSNITNDSSTKVYITHRDKLVF
jgi:hypothetical protein